MKPDSAPPSPPAYRPDIDGLRAVAILSVLGFHAFPAWVPGGFVGVDIFFVISGFLISGILLANLRKGQFNLADFYARRIRRIFPALFVVLAAVLAFGFFILWPGEYRQLGKHAAGGAGFIVNYLLMGEADYFDAQAETKPLLHLWSLGVEEQFYIFWPLMLWAAWRWKHRAGALIALVAAASFAANLWLADRQPVVDFYSPLSRFWELMAGGALAWGAQSESGWARTQSPVRATVLSLLGVALIGIGDFVFDNNMSFPGWLAALPVAGACLLIVAGANAALNRKILSSRAMVAIGLISYPLYLWHWPLLSYAQIVSGEAPSRLVRVEMVALAFALATLTYLFIERPIRRGGLGRHRILGLAGAMVIVASCGLSIVAMNGLPSRFVDGNTANALDEMRLIRTWQQNVRQAVCHIQDPDSDLRDPSCVEATRPLVMLWGDSHAASLYPGLKDLQAAYGFGIAQMTQSGCPPLFDVPKLTFRRNCNDLNRAVFDAAKQAKPEVIILASGWIHRDFPMKDDELFAHLQATIAQIKQDLPQTKIIVYGPEPRWLSPLPSLYRRALTLTHQTPPQRMADHFDSTIGVLDNKLSAALADSGVVYLSPQSKLCDAAGCETRLGDGLDSLTFIDAEHISAVESTRQMQLFAPEIVGGLGLSVR
jgi:peptidoglycan/LPS O-acetylase OafA/YrhL